MAKENRELNELFSLINKHIGTNFDSYRTEFIDGPEETIRLFAFTSDVSVEVDGTALPAGRYAMWSPIDTGLEEDIHVSGFQMCEMFNAGAENSETEDSNGFFLRFLFGRDREDGPALPIRFSDYLFEVLRSLSDEPEERIREAVEKFSLTHVSSGKQTHGEAGEEMQEPPMLEAIAPKKHLVSNSKPTHVLRQGKSPLLFEEEGAVLKVDRKSTQIQFALWQDEEASIEVSDKIDAEDVAVIEAVSTLKHAGNTVITPGQIIRNMGYKQSTSAMVEEIHQRVLRLMSIKGRIDWTQQANAWNLRNPDTGEPYEHAEIIGNLLSMTVFDGTDVKGNRDIRYKVASDPITYEHARLVHQVIEYPPELLDIAPIDEDGNELKLIKRDKKKLERAVLWYVFSLKNPKNHMNNYVTYEALFDYEGMKVNSDSSRKRAVKFVQAYLKALQRAGVIYAFTPKIEQSRRHKQLGVTIHVEK